MKRITPHEYMTGLVKNFFNDKMTKEESDYFKDYPKNTAIPHAEDDYLHDDLRKENEDE